MTPQDAIRLLSERADPGANWVLHSLQVGRVARALGRALEERGFALAPDDLCVQGLLHDVGRSFSHGPFHGWTGYVYLRSRGLGGWGRGCLVHWLKGRDRDELLATSRMPPGFVARVLGELRPPEWTLADSVVSLADSCVRHATIVPYPERHAELLRRYGESRWLRRAWELAEAHARQVEAALDSPLAAALEPLYGDTLRPGDGRSARDLLPR